MTTALADKKPRIISHMAEISSGTQRRLNEPFESSRAEPLFDERLLDEVVSEVVATQNKGQKLLTNLREVSFGAIAKLHELALALKINSTLMENLKRRAKVTDRKNTPYHLFVVKAVVRCAGTTLSDQTQNDWAKVLLGLSIAGVPREADAVINWLRTPEEGDTATGHQKAFAVVDRARAEAGITNAAAVARLKHQQERREKEWNDYVVSKREAVIAEIDLTQARPDLADGYALQLVHVEKGRAKVIDVVETDQTVVQRIVLSKLR